MLDGPAAAAVQTNTADRPVFCAGDSDTDTSFLQDATGLKLVLNRNKKELMCNAYGDFGGNWLVNPMFLAPKERLERGYACSVDACKDATGLAGPRGLDRGVECQKINLPCNTIDHLNNTPDFLGTLSQLA